MSAEVSDLISSSISLFLTLIINWFFIIYIYNSLLRRNHSLLLLCILVLFRIIFYNILVQNLLVYHYRDASWWGALNFVLYWLYILISLIISYWTFDEELLRLMITLSLGELPIAAYNVLLSAVINTFTVGNIPLAYFHSFNPGELFVITLGSLLFFKIMKLLLPVFKTLINHLLLYRKAIWVVCFSYLIMGCCSWMFRDSYSLNSLLILFWTGAILAGILYFTQKYTANTRRKNIFLKEQKNLMEIHYATVIRQIAQMGKSREIMAQQMKEISQIADQEIKKKKLVDYTLQVKKSYGEIQAGIYCDDWIIDSILYNKKEELAKAEIDFDISLQGYDRGRIEEKDLATILITLFEMNKKESEGGDKKKNLHLKIRQIKGQLILEYSVLSRKKAKEMKRKMMPYLKKYHGSCMIAKRDGEDVAVIHLLAV